MEYNNKFIIEDNYIYNDMYFDKNYELIQLHISYNQFNFIGISNGIGTISLYRDKVYILDTSHSSNIGHKIIVSRIPDSGKVNGLTYQGIPGKPGSFVSFYLGKARPSILYYYDQFQKGLGGQIDIIENNNN